MIFAFGAYELDTAAAELRRGGLAVPIEPQVLAVLRLLIEQRARLVSRDELIDLIWDGRIVSDAAVASRIKSARQAVGDSGEAQSLIRTLPKLGFRWVGEVTVRVAASAATVEEAAPVRAPETPQDSAVRPSIAVLKFGLLGDAGALSCIAEAVPADLILELSRLRWLFVIARASSFQLPAGAPAFDAVRNALRARYCLSGVIDVHNRRAAITVELCDTRDNGVVWSEQFRSCIDDVHDIRSRIVQAVVNALEIQIPLNEARASLQTPRHLDAWSAYHLGLHHLYKFDRAANRQAALFFAQAIQREPGFARAYAGLSFVHFEEAFLHFSPDTVAAAGEARRFAEMGLERDSLDPFCNLVMGRAFWLNADLESSLVWLDRAVALNPNYAQGRYSCAWTRTMLNEGGEGLSLATMASDLSPLDPLLYGMHGIRACAHMLLEQPGEAASWGERAARAPWAHGLIALIAAVLHMMNEDRARAAHWAGVARARQPGLRGEDFLRAFPFRDAMVRKRIERALAKLPV